VASLAFGSTVGLNPGRPDGLDLQEHLLYTCWGSWAVIGAWALWRLRTPDPQARWPQWMPMALAFIAPGSAFAWAAWGLLAALLRPGGYLPPEHLGVAVVEHLLSIGFGVVTSMAVVASARRHRGPESLPALSQAGRRRPTYPDQPR
jgi:hypothetical protein